MGELVVTASEFRVHMKELGNRVSSEQRRVLVARHGRTLFAIVSEEDFEFLQKHRPKPKRAPVPEPIDPAAARQAAEIPDVLEHPDIMATADIQRIYAATAGRKDPRVARWRGIAFSALRQRTGAYPDTLP